MLKVSRQIPVVSLALLAVAACSSTTPSQALSDVELRAIEAAHAAYGAGWRANDRAAVLATLAEDVVLMPSGMAPIEGRDAAEAFWWPDDGSATTITSYEGTIEEIRGSGDVAVVRARANMAFTWENDGETSEGTNRSMSISVLERGDDGRWRITMRMWGRLTG